MRMIAARPSKWPAVARPGWLVGWRLPTLAVALLVGLSGRIFYSLNTPLWFDETFTGVITSQPTLADLIGWCRSELTGPAFYAPFWLWVNLAGSSDLALRLPNLALSIATPLAILRFGNRDADLRLWWAVFVLLWAPFFAVAGEARGYPEIFALGTVQAIVFARLLERPTTKRASIWVAVSSLIVLCNYWGAVPALVQGLAFLAVHRLRAIRTWPSLAFLVPMLAWSVFHLPYVMAFAYGQSTGISGLPLSAVLDIPAFVFGNGLNGTLIFAIVLGSLAIGLARDDWRQRIWERIWANPDRAVAFCGIASIAAMLAMGFVRPGFAPRYMMAAMPSFLLGLALWARAMAVRNPRAVTLVVAIMVATAVGILGSILRDPESDPRHNFELERASAWLAQQPPEHLVVLWDNPSSDGVETGRLAELGGFFLHRAGYRVAVDVARAGAVADPNRAVLALTEARRKSAILWFANEEQPQSRAPRIESMDPRFECRNFDRGVVVTVACRWRR